MTPTRRAGRPRAAIATAALGLMATVAMPTPRAAVEPPGISLEIGNTPVERPRRAPVTEDGTAPGVDQAAVGPLYSVTAAGEAPGDYRRWGHLVGDRIRACVALATGQGAGRIPIDHDAGRVGLWLDRQATRTVVGDGGRALCIDYQVVNSPRTTTIAILPPVTLAADDGSPLTIPATSVSLGPLIPDPGVGAAPGAPPVLIDDRDAARFVIRPDPASLGRSALVLGLVLAGWLGFWWWQRGQDRLRQPFAGALHDLRRLRRQGAADSAQAWQAVHDGINRAAGRTVSSAGLPGLVRDLPWLAPFAPRLAHFFKASDARFFAQATVTEAFALEALCVDLRRVEREAGFEVAPRPDDDAGAATGATDATRTPRSGGARS